MMLLEELKRLAGITENTNLVNGYRVRIAERANPKGNLAFAMNEAKSWGFDEDKRGGIIVISTDVNAVMDEPEEPGVGGAVQKQAAIKRMASQLKSKAIALAKTWNNRIKKDSKVTATAKAVNARQDGSDDIIQGLSIGKLFKGRYISPETGKVYDEKSFTIEVAGISSERLMEFATQLARDFAQMEVLVKDANSGEVYFADRS